MFGFVVANIRVRLGRSLALLVGMLVATTAYTVLTSSTGTQRLAVVGTVRQETQVPYQILARPKGARTDLESQRGIIRPNFLAGQYGGITTQQWRAIQGIDGVQVAAPVAMAGYSNVRARASLDLTGSLDSGRVRQVLRISPEWRAERGLTDSVDTVPGFVYVTRRPVLWPNLNIGTGRPAEPAFPGAADCSSGLPAPWEVQPDGRRVPLCLGDAASPLSSSVSFRRSWDAVVQVLPDGRFSVDGGQPQERLVVQMSAPVPLLVAAIDPSSEAALVGLDKAVVSGRYLSASDGLTRDSHSTSSFPVYDAQVLVAAHASVDEQLLAWVGRDTALSDQAPPASLATSALQAMRTTPVGNRRTVSSVEDLYQTAINTPPEGALPGEIMVLLTQLVRADLPEYTINQDGSLVPQEQPPTASLWDIDESTDGGSDNWIMEMPWLATDSGFRQVQRFRSQQNPYRPDMVAIRAGVFDPTRVGGVGGLGSVPLETYARAQATGADAASRGLLHDQPLLPDDNVGGYLATAPSILMSLRTLQDLRPTRNDLISAVRVRVAGVAGFDQVSRERVRLVAEQIARRTGLDVDIVFGSSPAQQTIALPAGRLGRPQLSLSEPWSKLNVAVHLLHAIDRKSAALFVLILVVCVLFLANATAAAVRERRRDLAILACLGWPRRRLLAALLGEIALIGLGAGLLSAALALPLGHLVGTSVPIGRALLAIPVALGLAVLAGVQPALSASRAHPMTALTPPSIPARRAVRRRFIAGLATSGLGRNPGRTLLAALALAVGVCALSLLAVIQWAFRGAAVGTLLGDAVAVQVRGVDLIAVALTGVLGVVAVADVLYLNVRERATEYATLQATGWSQTALARLVGYEALGLGLLGSLTGAGAAIGLAIAFLGHDSRPSTVVPAAALVAVLGVLLAQAAVAVPVLLLRRIPTAHLLAEE